MPRCCSCCIVPVFVGIMASSSDKQHSPPNKDKHAIPTTDTSPTSRSASKKQKGISSSTNYVFIPGSQVHYENTNHIKSIKCKIQGIPRPQYRCFATTKGSNSGKPHLFSPSKDNQSSFKAAFNQALACAPSGLFNKSLNNPVTVSVRFYFPHPKKHYIPDGNGNLVLSPMAPTVVTKMPDLDNCIKLVLDAIEDICYSNDYIVVQINSSKVFDDTQTVWSEQKEQPSSGWTIIKVSEINDSIFVQGCNCLCCERKSLRKASGPPSSSK